MSNLRDRFRTLDNVSAPDLWSEAIGRAAEGKHRPAMDASQGRRWGMSPVLIALVTFLLLTGLLAGAIAGGWLSDERSVLVPSPSPSIPETSNRSSNGVIAYAGSSGLSALYLVRPGDQPRQIAPGSAAGNKVACPTFSPDGRMLAFGMPGGSIGVVPIDEQGVTGDGARHNAPVSETPHCSAWAPDSSAVAFLDGSALVILPLDGEAQRIEGWDIDNTLDGAFYTDYPGDRAVQWSPDGSTIAVARASGTWLVPVDGTAPLRLHETPAFSVSWSPDATRLVIGIGGPGALVIRASDGTTVAELSTGFGPPVWSPVEDRIALVENGGLVVVAPDGADGVVIDSYGYHPTWSPDGQQLIYMKDTGSTSWRLVMSRADGTSDTTTIVDGVTMPTARSFPGAQQFSWQPIPAR